MEEHNCAKFGRCNNPFHDHDEDSREPLPDAVDLVDTEDPAFDTVARLLTDLRDAKVKLTGEIVRAAVALGRHYHQRSETPLPVPGQRVNELHKPVVYYIRVGNLIKIGTTIDMRQRMNELKPDEILGAEAGSYELERQRHQQFARFRAHGEYFLPARPLTDHINAVRKKYGRTPRKLQNLRRTRTVLEKSPETLF